MKIQFSGGSATEKAALADLLREHGIEVEAGDGNTGNTLQFAPAFRGTRHSHSNNGSLFETEHFLARVTAGFAESLDYQTTLFNVARLCVPFLADWCVVDMLEEGGTIARLAVTHADGSQVQLARMFKELAPPTIDSDHILSRVIRTGESNYVGEVNDDILMQTARHDKHLQMLRAIGICSHMIVPLKARGQT